MIKQITQSPNFKFILISLGICCIGLIGIAMVFFNGQENSYGVSREVPLGLLLMGYAFFVGISVGLATIVSLVHLFKFDVFCYKIRHIQLISLAALIAAFWLIFWELGSPFKLQVLRFVQYYINFQIHSPIWWMSTFYMIEAPLLVLELYLLMKNSHRASFWAGIVGFIMGIVAFSTLSMVFAVNGARPIWHTAGFTISFILGALVCGAGVMLIFMNFRQKQPKPQAVKSLSTFMFFFLLGILFVNIWTLIISLYSKGSYLAQNFEVLTNGALSFNFYFFETIVGIILPIILLVLGKFENIKFSLFASIFAIIGVFFGRFDGVVGGQLVRVESGFLPNIEYVSYMPSIAEITIFISAIGVMMFIYEIGSIYLKLDQKEG